MEFSAQQIADFLNGEVIGDKDIKVNNHTLSHFLPILNIRSISMRLRQI